MASKKATPPRRGLPLVPAVLAAALAATAIDSANAQHDRTTATEASDEEKIEADKRTPYPYAVLIPDTVSYCYNRLIKDTSCCLDEHRAAGVRRDIVRRPGTQWECKGTECFDTRKGNRGDDAIFLPENADCDSPRLLWVHGGSWMYGSPTTDGYTEMGTKIAATSGAVVMMVDYPLSPVGNYTTISAAVLSGLKYLATARLGELECSEKQSLKAPLFIGGDSAGGGTALSMVLYLKKMGGWGPSGITTSHPELLPEGKILAGAIFYSPWTNLRCDTPDYYYNSFAKIVESGSTPVYTGDLMFRGHPYKNLDQFTANANVYVSKNSTLITDPLASPFFAGEDELGGGGLPPMYFAVGGSESILGDSLIFAQKAALYGADVQLEVHVGMWHDFPMYSEGCGKGDSLWQAVRVLNKTGQFIKRVSRANVVATSFGLQWPPSRYQPGTPETTYVYDLTRDGTEEWFPKKLDQAQVEMATQGVQQLAAYPGKVEAATPTLPSEALMLAVGAGCTLGVFLVLTLQSILPSLVPRRARRSVEPMLEEVKKPLLADQ
mmetsp:Transcript_68122/g.142306  ORF Transcript_68122/g.142306 Transcript_68122/m.142306 type:complete len:550 (+) Transcript_68122:135-1784(+)|eukprot:CAMPEP_0206451742 /NCGR_PEP_ID=MMETSP0324_2-20121206/19532_1 /ASSEMBLY_ACC=CAM_ASM_000836 /TAXON_ID=2866 /ORGANISM="Crypthecodinium cohnii, Strain Seligo" /LENGTH=549 /DNA_ID=CAMNT_0053921701 /DNA_START=125 /DNA_END=1774 /DNA_ORIENTATION=+